MIETDAPYILPRDLPPAEKPSNGRNEPRFLPHVARVVARCRDESADDLARTTTATACALFGLS